MDDKEKIELMMQVSSDMYDCLEKILTLEISKVEVFSMCSTSITFFLNYYYEFLKGAGEHRGFEEFMKKIIQTQKQIEVMYDNERTSE